MTDKTTPIEPCPFCEGLSIFCFDVAGLSGASFKQLVCASCGSAGPIAENKAKAIEKWNWRPTCGYANAKLEHGETP
jgi:Lar family restriction alleviation protein